MTWFDELLAGGAIAVTVVGVFLLIRNERAYSIRISFINDEKLYPESYKRLPAYDDMVSQPKHFLRWTRTQWIKYVAEVK